MLFRSNFDETTGSTAFDATANANNGILINSAGRALSGAAIGDESSFAYDLINFFPLGRPYPSAGIAYGLQDSAGFSFIEEQANQLGNTIGVQVYLIKEKPGSLNGITGIGSNDRYFGLFSCNNIYEIGGGIYNYTNNPFVNGLNESDLRLFIRDNNSDTTWTLYGQQPNTVNNTFTPSLLGKEFMLGNIGSVLPTVSIADKSLTEGNTGATQLKMTVTLSKVSASVVSVNYKTANKTATAGSDYTAVNKTLKFNPGQTSKKVTIEILGDVTVEPNEDFNVILFNPSNALLDEDTAVVKIKNDDGAAVVSAQTNDLSLATVGIKLSPNPAPIYATQLKNMLNIKL